MKKLVIGILAHVDAGKTTLAESLLYVTGGIRRFGRVDHKDAFLDTYELERSRGITIFSKQAELTYDDMGISLLDTPGHVDFSAEMERTLQVLDYAILVISGSEGVQGHTETLWRLLNRYHIPTFLFVNKMDLEGSDRHKRMAEFKKHLDEGCIEFDVDRSTEEFLESIAICDENLLNKYMDHGVVDTEDIVGLIKKRKVFPCYFGSALRIQGIEGFLMGLKEYTEERLYPKEFGAKVYKIARDEQGNRLTYMKITGGSLKVKMSLTNGKENNPEQGTSRGGQESEGKKLSKGYNLPDKLEIWEEKVDQIRVYSGVRYDTIDELEAGAVCAVTGLSKTYPGEGLGREAGSDIPLLEPVLNYQIILPSDCNAFQMLTKLRQLEEEDPTLHILWSEQHKEIHVQLMGEVQIEVLKSLIAERFEVDVEFGSGTIVYKETIEEPMVGVGHYEPLRHYAEVHLLLEPGEQGSGCIFASQCSEDDLDRNWQRLILTHLEEKEHIGVLTGAPITDVRITLLAGRAHQKHTEGGDFRQATYRAIRQGLKKAKSILLEPYYNFKLEIPSELVGRAMTDIQRMNGSFTPPELVGEISILTGYAPAATMRGYQTEVTAYSRGRGKLFCTLKGYLPCHNSDEVIEAFAYDSERDMDHPTGSVFCSHGAGFAVPWNEVEAHMHLDTGWQQAKEREEAEQKLNVPIIERPYTPSRDSWKEDKELEEIFIRTYGPMNRRLPSSQNRLGYEKNKSVEPSKTRSIPWREKKAMKEYLLVDGYNIIFSWEELNDLAKENLDGARNKLMDILSNYQGYRKNIVILVFDAYKVKGGQGSVMEHHNIHVVYTKEAETADQYIEKVTHNLAGENYVTVATSDALEQLIIMGKGAIRMSAKDLKEEMTRVRNEIQRDYLDGQPSGRSYLGEKFDVGIIEYMDDEEKE